MTERERLIDMIYNADEACTLSWAEIIADHLLSKGVIAPPCKLGDVVYDISYQIEDSSNIIPFEVTKIELGQDLNRYHIKRMGSGVIDEIYDDDFGTTIFLSPEEAEQALKARQPYETG